MYTEFDNQARWTLPAVIEEQGRAKGTMLFATTIDGNTLSYREVSQQSRQVAQLFAFLGVQRGDRVAIMHANGLDFIRAWAGIGRLGAVAVLLNVELKGEFLAHQLRDSAACVVVADKAATLRIRELEPQIPELRHILTSGPDGSFIEWSVMEAFDGPLPGPAELACIMYTSGTTGVPKGVLMPHAHCYLFGRSIVENMRVRPEDHYYVCLPLSHANGLFMHLGATLIAGAQATIKERFSASAWLKEVCDSGATITHVLGAMSAFVISQPPGDRDRSHKLRAILATPNVAEHEEAWRNRFGLTDVIGAFGMTEVNIPLFGRCGETRPGSCGRPYDRFFEVRLGDLVTGQPVPTGLIGEILVRPRTVNGFMAGYNNLPEKTVEAWRGLWFHTGDLGREEQDGYFTFVDRIKDSIRRRGENVSATDVENAISALPGVAEVAAYAVPSHIAGGEEEIMIRVVPRPEANVSIDMIAKHSREFLPRFAQPRYLAMSTDLPKTPTEKVRKDVLRELGITPDAIDLDHLPLITGVNC